ncbi:MAG TPA: hypothetical protein VM513_01245 [Kofleriaceae bacterium]|jgi:hypothetical protein|nr:hypothetical protein [Kofleriaceae bacterium]
MTKHAIVALVVLAGCPAKEDYTKQKPEEGPAAKPAGDRPAPPPPPPKKKGPPEDLGKCDLKLEGGMTAEQSSPGGKTAANVAYWYVAEERKNMMGVDGYVVNCHGPSFKFTLLPGGGSPDVMPFEPKTFTFTKGKSNGANVMLAVGQATLADPNGKVEITALDKRHIAGTVELSGKMVPGNKQVKLTGSFDYVCPGFSACEFE